MVKDNYLFFWRPNQEHGVFSQWYFCNFSIKGIKYFCAEQAMMSLKALLFDDMETYQKIMSSKNPKEIKDLGKEVKNFDQKIWDANKETIVYGINFYKFAQNPKLSEQLLDTGDLTLAEASPYDKIWGIGRDVETLEKFGNYTEKYWKGQNLLGKSLMRVRETIKQYVEETNK